MPKALGRLKSLLETLRSLAGEAHERKAAPVRTWAEHGRRVQRGNAIRLIGVAAKASGDRRLGQRKAGIQREAQAAGLEAVFHVREDARGVLPWPPFEVLALVPAGDLLHAADTVHESVKPLRRIVDATTRLTVVPMVDGFAVPALGLSGYETLYPDAVSGAGWLEYVGIDGLHSDAAETFGQVLDLAAQLGAMDSRGLGLAGRPSEETDVREALEGSLGERRVKLDKQLRRFDRDLGERILGLVAAARAGKVDYMAEVQDRLGGASPPALEETGYLTLRLVEEERARRLDGAGVGGTS